MGFLGKASEFFAEAGASVGSFVGDALHNVSNYACQLHYNTPGVIFDVSPFNRELWREFCRDRPAGLPSPPVPPFRGGQCDAVKYVVNMRIYATTYGAGYNDSLFVAYGPIASVELVPFEENGIKIFNVVANCRGPGFSGDPVRPQGNYVVHQYGDSVRSTYKSWSVTSLYRLDGQPDNCGDLPSGVQPVVLPVSQRTTTINIKTDQDNSVVAILDFPSASVDFNLSVPLKVTIDNRKFHLNIDGWYTGFPSPPVSLPDVKKILSDNVLQFEGTLNQYFAPINPSMNNNLVLVSPSAGKKKGGEEKIFQGRNGSSGT